ncbi:hypothetical protein [Dehalobacter restrictus]|uniref:hypothetical protein n=1 Tax=Dehalobacter restrictus TaxID=55583 RepID=UPI00338E2788
MKKTIFALVLVGTMLISTGSVFAAVNGTCDQDRDQTRLKLKDGSCQTAMKGAGDRDQIRLFLRDGSCQTV